MKTEIVTTGLLAVYNFAWQAVLPLLKTHQRLKPGFSRRTSAAHFSKCDIWIQAASAGEAYLACSLVKSMRFQAKTQVLVSTTTIQGMEILEKELAHRLPNQPLNLSPNQPQNQLANKNMELGPAQTLDPSVKIMLAWFPFDMPSLMESAVKRIDPAVMVLLETELWPGLLSCLKRRGTEIIMVNARLSEKSFKGYRRTAFLWRHLAPDTILAISVREAERFAALFPKAEIKVMPNIKFDALTTMNGALPKTGTDSNENNLNPKIPVSILASIRREEEEMAQRIVARILKGFPNQVVAIFPRHMERIRSWERNLTRAGYNWCLRSRRSDLKTVEPGSIILWDTFGELKQACSVATTAFVGGSLLPLGGQNFMEPAMAGAATVTGPHLKDFLWVGEEIFQKKIVHRAKNWQQVADFMIENLVNVPRRSVQEEQTQNFIQTHQGGTRLAVNQITRSMQRQKWNQ